jgi:hypothetical protein
MSDENRKAFEAWDANKERVELFEDYGLTAVMRDVSWEAWQAATAHAQARTCKWTFHRFREEYAPACGEGVFHGFGFKRCPDCGGKVEVVSE